MVHYSPAHPSALRHMHCETPLDPETSCFSRPPTCKAFFDAPQDLTKRCDDVWIVTGPLYLPQVRAVVSCGAAMLRKCCNLTPALAMPLPAPGEPASNPCHRFTVPAKLPPPALQRSPQPQKTGAPGYRMQHEMIGEGCGAGLRIAAKASAMQSSAMQEGQVCCLLLSANTLRAHAFHHNLLQPLPNMLQSCNCCLRCRHAAAADGGAHPLLQGVSA